MATTSGSQARRRLRFGLLVAVITVGIGAVIVATVTGGNGAAEDDTAEGDPAEETTRSSTASTESMDVPTSTTVPPSRAAVPLPDSLTDFFPIGVDFQPTENFEVWKERGINTLIRAPDGADINEWADAADAAGLYQIRPPRDPPSADIGNPLLLAWSHRDEPEFNPRQIPAGDIRAQYETWKQIDPDRPVLINISGDMDSSDRSTGVAGAEFYRQYFAAADWLSGDIYPVNRNEPLTRVGRMVDEIEVLADGKPVFAYIETSDYDTDDVNSTIRPGAPTAEELRGEVWHAIIHGARGIWYFPERISPTFGYDDTPDDVAAEMPRLHELITSLASVLQGPIDPPGIAATVSPPLEVGWRDTPSGSYFMVLNMSNEPRAGASIRLDGVGEATSAEVYGEDRSVAVVDGTITDDFGPYAVHIYQLSR